MNKSLYREKVEVEGALRSSGWVLPDEPVPVRLMNTVWADRRGVHDDLADQEGLAAWLSETGMHVHGSAGVGPRPTAAELALARRTRDALRRLAAAATADTRLRAGTGLDEDDAAEALNEVLPAAGHHLLARDQGRWRWDRPRPGSVRQALGQVAEAAAPLLTGDGPLLRACYAPGCVLYFVRDHPRREWCSTACGNRVRAARHYARSRLA